MGCSTSKLDDEEAVKLCKDRKRFIRQAVEHRARFSSAHLAYFNSVKRVSAALRDYLEEGGEDHRRVLSLDHHHHHSFAASPHQFIATNKKKPSQRPRPRQRPRRPRPDNNNNNNNGFITISPSDSRDSRVKVVNYLRSSGSGQAVTIEERPPRSQFRVDAMQYSPSPAMDSSYYFFGGGYNSPARPSVYVPPSPPAQSSSSQWDFFWNPFSSLDNYGYPNDHHPIEEEEEEEEEGTVESEDRVREEEGIPDLEDDEEDDDDVIDACSDCDCDRERVIVEDVDEDEEEEQEEEEAKMVPEETTTTTNTEQVISSKRMSRENRRGPPESAVEISTRTRTAKQVEVDRLQHHRRREVGDLEETRDGVRFTAYANRRPTSMAEVMKELEDQFVLISSAADEVAALLEARKARHYTTSQPSAELTVKKMLNPVALIRSGSSRTSSSRFAIVDSSNPADDEEERSGDVTKDCSFPGSHRLTLERLYAWEKKLYDEVRAGEKVRLAYEKKCMQLRNHDMRGDEASSVEKTRTVVRDLHTQIKVSIHSVEAISTRIETLREQELQPQLLDLVKGISRMWKSMAESHKSQKRTLDEAKLLLAGTPFLKKHPVSDPQRAARSAATLESELRNWRACFAAWIASQRSYARALTGWLLRCCGRAPPNSDETGLPVFVGLLIQWSRSLDAAREAPVLDGLDFFAAGMGSLYSSSPAQYQQHRPKVDDEDDHNNGLEVGFVGNGDGDDVSMTAEKLAEVGVRVLCAGMSVATASLAEFSLCSAKGYGDLVSQWDGARWRDLGVAAANGGES